MTHRCELITEQGPALKVSVIYICVTRGDRALEYAKRFSGTWRQFEPGYPCELLVVCNGGRLAVRIEQVFKPMDCQFVLRPNDGGKDISAYQDIASGIKSDFMVCLGDSVYFHRGGWLERLAEARAQFGPGMYGAFATHSVRTHLHTTMFAIDPVFLRMYPPVMSNAERYQFEHGPGCLWHRLGVLGGRAWLVTWDGCYQPEKWRLPPNIIWRGTQENCLMFCNHTQRYEQANALNKFTWARNADGPYRL